MSRIQDASPDTLWLLSALCDDAVDREQLERLETSIGQDRDGIGLLLDYLQLHSDLRFEFIGRKASAPTLREIGNISIEANAGIPLALIAPNAAASRSIEALPDSGVSPPVQCSIVGDESGPARSPVLPFLSTTLHGAVDYFSSGWPLAYLVATVIFGIGVLVGAVTPVSHPVQIAGNFSPPVSSAAGPEMVFVGQITGLVDCQWSDPAAKAVNGSYVPLGCKYALSSGLMEITYDTGAKVILQGPATYEIQSVSGGYLSHGKLTARLDKRGEGREERGEGTPNPQIPNPKSGTSPLSPLPSPLFTIKTPTATVTDLGTEFGVEVSMGGDTTSHVFQGSVALQAVYGKQGADGAVCVLHQNETARVEKSGDRDGNRVRMLSRGHRPIDFVREIPRSRIKTLDLVDVVAGGDGFSGRRGRGIDPSTGQPADNAQAEQHHSKSHYRLFGDYKYHRAEANPFVDGVFIPDGKLGPVQIDSAGHTFSYFATTANSVTINIWAGGAVTTHRDSEYQQVRTKLGDIEYAAPGHGLIFMAANSAITFDLDAIRQANPNCKLLRFRAVAGNTEMRSQEKELKGTVGADIWVLVDGVFQFKRRDLNYYTGEQSVNVPLGDRSRFLTLVATDGGNGTWSDWTMFGDPRLELIENSIPNPNEGGKTDQ